jgi:hypothetical protein
VRFHDQSTDRNFDHSGRAPRAAEARRLRGWGAIAALLVLALPLPALAAKLVEVRVGRHPGYTRVVLQTDAPIEYTLTRSETGNVRLQLAADASPRRLTSKSDVLREVIVEDTGDGSLARLNLHRPDVAVKEMVLKNPPRIVLDLTPGVPQPALAASKAPAEPPSAAAPPAEKPPVAAPVVAPSVVAVSEPEPETAQALERAAPTVTAAGTGGRLLDSKVEPTPEAAAAKSEEPGATSGDTAPVAAVADTADTKAGAPDAGDTAEAPAETGSGNEADAAGSPVQDVASADADAGRAGGGLREMPKPPPARRPRTEEPPPVVVEPPAGVFGFLPVPFDDPLVLGGIAGMLVLIAALVTVRRRGAAREDEFESPFAPPEPFSMNAEPASTAASFDVPAPAVDVSGDVDLPVAPGQQPEGPGGLFSSATGGFEDGDSLFSGDAETEEEKAEARVFTPVPAADVGAAGAPPAGGDVMRVVEELERRMGQMETRLEEVMDAKERLERQVSAQTEELRVQRAAIARTQRVLRNVSRPEDEATEPAPKL